MWVRGEIVTIAFDSTPTFNYAQINLSLAHGDGTESEAYLLMAETKGSMSSMELRKIEECKMDCARKFSSKITSDQVKYDIVNSYAKHMERVK